MGKTSSQRFVETLRRASAANTRAGLFLFLQYYNQGGYCRIGVGSKASQPVYCFGLFIWAHATKCLDNFRRQWLGDGA